LKDKILAKKLKTKEVVVDGEKVKVRELTGSERVALGDIEGARNNAAFVFLKAVDLGVTVSDKEFEKMFDLDIDSITDLVQEVYNLSNLGADASEEAEKN